MFGGSDDPEKELYSLRKFIKDNFNSSFDVAIGFSK